MDDHGQDVTAIVSALEGRYLDTFGRGQYQGITRDHYVEVDLGDDAPNGGENFLHRRFVLLSLGVRHYVNRSCNRGVTLRQRTHNCQPNGVLARSTL